MLPQIECTLCIRWAKSVAWMMMMTMIMMFVKCNNNNNHTNHWNYDGRWTHNVKSICNMYAEHQKCIDSNALKYTYMINSQANPSQSKHQQYAKQENWILHWIARRLRAWKIDYCTTYWIKCKLVYFATLANFLFANHFSFAFSVLFMSPSLALFIFHVQYSTTHCGSFQSFFTILHFPSN